MTERIKKKALPMSQVKVLLNKQPQSRILNHLGFCLYQSETLDCFYVVDDENNEPVPYKSVTVQFEKYFRKSSHSIYLQ